VTLYPYEYFVTEIIISKKGNSEFKVESYRGIFLYVVKVVCGFLKRVTEKMLEMLISQRQAKNFCSILNKRSTKQPCLKNTVGQLTDSTNFIYWDIKNHPSFEITPLNLKEAQSEWQLYS
jgi:predicted transport protein